VRGSGYADVFNESVAFLTRQGVSIVGSKVLAIGELRLAGVRRASAVVSSPTTRKCRPAGLPQQEEAEVGIFFEGTGARLE
jgi:hypothetical protein